MKFHQLTIGQRFEFEGEVYVYTRPMVAVSEASGQQRFMRRSATVRVLAQGEAATTAPADAQDTPGREAVVEAFDAFYARCLLSIEENTENIDSTALQRLRADFEKARQRFLRSLSLQ